MQKNKSLIATDSGIVLGSRRAALCLVHCVALPFLLAGMPALARFESSLGTGFHIAMAVLVTVTVVPALRGGFKRHRDVPTLAFGGWGLTLILIGLLASDGHGGHDHASHAEADHHAAHDHGHDDSHDHDHATTNTITTTITITQPTRSVGTMPGMITA